MGLMSVDSMDLATNVAKASALADIVGYHNSNGLRLI